MASDQGQRVAVVTGAAQGIGAAIAELFAESGLHVVLLDIQEKGEEVAQRLSALGGSATFQQCDLTELADVSSVARQVEQNLGGVDVLINNAGWTPNERFAELHPSQWQRIIGVNLLAVLNTCHAFLPQLSSGSAVVNVASDAGRIGVPKQAVYSGAKAGVIGFSKALAAEVAPQGIRVNVVCPGTTRTPLLAEALTDEEITKRVRQIPLRRLAEPMDVARTVWFLAADAPHVTGQVVSVSGGATRVD